MGNQVSLQHTTRYRYAGPVALGPQVVQLRPAPHCRTPILGYSLTVTPADHRLRWQFDSLGNHVARLLVPGRTAEFALDVELIADLTPYNPFDFILDPGGETFPFSYPAELARDLEPYRLTGQPGPKLRGFLGSIPRDPQPTVSFLVALNSRLRDTLAYTTRLEHGVQSPEDTLTRGSGSCRDSAWLLAEICRNLGLAARFVSGYLIQLVANAADPTAPGPKADTADLHAWTEVYLPGAGWIGLDPTSGLFAAEGHIPLACAPTPGQAAPIGGTVEPSEVEFHHAIALRRLDGSAGLANPYSRAEWEHVRAVAHTIDDSLDAGDVRLTTGGEPTYVGMDEAESPQWNIEALGSLKRTLGLALIRSLRERTAPGALLQLGQGKWYPGEALPRWAFHCISRLDGVPVWERGDLFAREDAQYGFDGATALRFLEALTRRLEVDAANILPAFDPAGFGAGEPASDTPAGYVLPLRRRQPAGRLAWSSQLWFPRPERLLLSFGDSPVGYRIPVEAMPWVAPDTLVYEHETGEHSDRIQLPPHPARRPELFARTAAVDSLPPIPTDASSAPELIRPSLCVQVREGRLHVFLPYTPVIADYLDLVAALEDTCVHLGIAIWIEGYTPPADPRVRSFSLTPDPGVLEVNLPPTGNWDELEELSAILAEEAAKLRLIPSKFAYDGSHLATGGGSHIVLGGATLPESPLLRRPDLLRSMIAFWQNHPSLSYLFSGMYVGPTSQYPRVDEARADALYELELSFNHLPADGCPPHVLDGLFRNLLVDVTGNTHRAEFCIDKLYPPEGTGLRLGLLELRAFEMAPQYQMGLLQMLLVRAFVAKFWKAPFKGDLIRWGTALHDRFMLPHFVERDFAEVLDALRGEGFAFEDSWFAPHREFRFPRIGSLTAEGVELELRQALEPWNVLAEETSSGRTGRSVDSSLERMQVRLSGLTVSSRFVVTCNDRRVPLHPTGTAGEAVAGIRYRARRLMATLHPTIPVHTPLTFDLIDTWKGRSVGRCIYHAGPRDGTVHTGRPADAAEARERRLQRFEVTDPPAEAISLPPDEINPVFPMTLDMRWPSATERANSRGPGLTV